MTTLRIPAAPTTNSSAAAAFPVVRKGYDPGAVDAFAHDISVQLRESRQDYEVAWAEIFRLRDELARENARVNEVDFSSLGDRARTILRIAEEQARELLDKAAQEAEWRTDQTEHELGNLRASAAEDLTRVRATQLAELDALRRRGEHDAAQLVELARVECERMLAGARTHAEALDNEARHNAETLAREAQLQAQALVAGAQRAESTIRTDAANEREQTLAQVRREHDQMVAATRALRARARDFHQQSAEHLSAESEQATRLRAEALAGAEQTQINSVRAAAEIVDRAVREAATIDERGRQEFAWRRRQIRHEQDLLSRRKIALRSQLTSLSALAAETVGRFPELPELTFDDDAVIVESLREVSEATREMVDATSAQAR